MAPDTFGTVATLSVIGSVPATSAVHAAGRAVAVLATGGVLRNLSFGGRHPFLRADLGGCRVTVGLGLQAHVVGEWPAGPPGVAGSALLAVSGVLANFAAAALAWVAAGHAMAAGFPIVAGVVLGGCLGNALVGLVLAIPIEGPDGTAHDGLRFLGLFVPRLRVPAPTAPRAARAMIATSVMFDDPPQRDLGHMILAWCWAALGEADAARVEFDMCPDLPADAEPPLWKARALVAELAGVGTGQEAGVSREGGAGVGPGAEVADMVARQCEVDLGPAGDAGVATSWDAAVAAWRASDVDPVARFVIGEALVARLPVGDTRRSSIAREAEALGWEVLVALPAGAARDRVELRVCRLGVVAGVQGSDTAN